MNKTILDVWGERISQQIEFLFPHQVQHSRCFLNMSKTIHVFSQLLQEICSRDAIANGGQFMVECITHIKVVKEIRTFLNVSFSELL